MSNLLQIDNLSVHHCQNGQKLLDNINIILKTNRTLAIVGESGSGKSLLVKAILGLLPSALQFSGNVYWQKQPLRDVARLRGRHIGLIVQNAMSAFNPIMKIQKQCLETLRYHHPSTMKTSLAMIEELLKQVQLTPTKDFLQAYPNQLSGGQLQRIMLALTLALKPQLIIADEPTTALDSLTQHEILPLFKQISRQEKRSLIFITHDIAIAKYLADEILVLKEGKVVEHQSAQDLFHFPLQPYTRYLLEMSDKLNQPLLQIMQGEGNVITGE